jgi:hypothetical protein
MSDPTYLKKSLCQHHGSYAGTSLGIPAAFVNCLGQEVVDPKPFKLSHGSDSAGEIHLFANHVRPQFSQGLAIALGIEGSRFTHEIGDGCEEVHCPHAVSLDRLLLEDRLVGLLIPTFLGKKSQIIALTSSRRAWGSNSVSQKAFLRAFALHSRSNAFRPVLSGFPSVLGSIGKGQGASGFWCEHRAAGEQARSLGVPSILVAGLHSVRMC